MLSLEQFFDFGVSCSCAVWGYFYWLTSGCILIPCTPSSSLFEKPRSGWAVKSLVSCSRLSGKADWLRGSPGIVAESLNKDLNPLPMSGLLLPNALLMRIVWLMLGINYSNSEESSPSSLPPFFSLLLPTQPRLQYFFFSFKIRNKPCKWSLVSENALTDITVSLNNLFSHTPWRVSSVLFLLLLIWQSNSCTGLLSPAWPQKEKAKGYGLLLCPHRWAGWQVQLAARCRLKNRISFMIYSSFMSLWIIKHFMSCKAEMVLNCM